MTADPSADDARETVHLRTLLDLIQQKKVPDGYALALYVRNSNVPVHVSEVDVSVVCDFVVVSGRLTYQTPFLQVFPSQVDFMNNLTLATKTKARD